jgi:hypothetical protein
MTSGYYLAATFERHAEMRRYRDQLESTWPGQVKVTSRWIDLHGGDELEASTAAQLNEDPTRCWKFGQADVADVNGAHVFVLFTGDGPSARGGRHTEFGRAQEQHDQYNVPRLVIVGPRENVFHCHPDVEVYPDWAAFLAAEKERYLLPGQTRPPAGAATCSMPTMRGTPCVLPPGHSAPNIHDDGSTAGPGSLGRHPGGAYVLDVD